MRIALEAVYHNSAYQMFYALIFCDRVCKIAFSFEGKRWKRNHLEMQMTNSLLLP